MYSFDMIASLLCATLMSPIQDQLPVNIADMKKFTLLIFERGASREKFKTEELQKMQEGHIANLVRLYGERKAPCAGPFGDDGDWRGIVVLNLDKKDVPSEFLGDPFVKAGLLKYSLHTWFLHKDTFAWPKEDMGMEEFTFVRLLKGSEWSAAGSSDMQVEHLKRNVELVKTGLVGVVGPMMEDTDWRGSYIFYGKDREAIEQELKKDPTVASGRLKYELKPLWMGKGLFKKVY